MKRNVKTGIRGAVGYVAVVLMAICISVSMTLILTQSPGYGIEKKVIERESAPLKMKPSVELTKQKKRAYFTCIVDGIDYINTEDFTGVDAIVIVYYTQEEELEHSTVWITTTDHRAQSILELALATKRTIRVSCYILPEPPREHKGVVHPVYVEPINIHI